MENRAFFKRVAIVALIVGVLVGVIAPEAASARGLRADSVNYVSSVTSSHPRLITNSAQITDLKSRIVSDPQSKLSYAKLRTYADSLLTAPVVAFNLTNGQLLMVSRTMLDDSYTLGLMWQLTQDSKYAERLWLNLDAATRFSD